MKEYKHLYVNGSSEATGWGVFPEDHESMSIVRKEKLCKESSFPTFLKESFGAEVLINRSSGGSTNNRILRTTLDWVLDYINQGHDPSELFVYLTITMIERKPDEIVTVDGVPIHANVANNRDSDQLEKYLFWKKEPDIFKEGVNVDRTPRRKTRVALSENQAEALCKPVNPLHLADEMNIERTLQQIVTIKDFLDTNGISFFIHVGQELITDNPFSKNLLDYIKRDARVLINNPNCHFRYISTLDESVIFQGAHFNTVEAQKAYSDLMYSLIQQSYGGA